MNAPASQHAMTTRSTHAKFCKQAINTAAQTWRKQQLKQQQLKHQQQMQAKNDKVPFARKPVFNVHDRPVLRRNAVVGYNDNQPAMFRSNERLALSQTRETSSGGSSSLTLPQPSASNEHTVDNVWVGTAETIGLRPSMEDQFVVARHVTKSGNLIWLFGVLDGHGGAEASRFVAEQWPRLLFGYLDCANGCHARSVRQALETSVTKINEMLYGHFIERAINLDTGTTLCAIMVVDGSAFYSINVGDSRALALRGPNYEFMGALSRDHKPANPSERKRIEALGGFITERNGDVPRVIGNLAVSRALGDFPSTPYVTHDPDVVGPRPMRDVSAIIVCCDGVTDVLENREIGQLVADKLRLGSNDNCADSKVQDAAIHLRNSAFLAQSGDNISALIVKFPFFEAARYKQ